MCFVEVDMGLSLNELIEKLQDLKRDEDFNNKEVFVTDSNGTDYAIQDVTIISGFVVID